MKTIENKLNKLFFETKMTWPRVILLAVGSAVLTAAVLIIPFLAKTSISYLGVTPEAWFVPALIIILNCEKPLEAAIKTFVFFLVSQPLIYLLQVPFSSMGWGLFGYYGYWFAITLLTFPGALLAWLVKKNNIFSALVMSVATGFVGMVFAESLAVLLRDFPDMLVRVLFTLLEIVVFIFLLLKGKKGRGVCLTITLLVIVGVLVLRFAGREPVVRYYYELDDGHTWTISDTKGDVGNVEVVEDGLEILANRYSFENVILTNELGETMTLYITYDEYNGVMVSQP